MDPKRFWKKVISHPLPSMAADYFKSLRFDTAGKGGVDPNYTSNTDDAMDGDGESD